MTKNLSTMARKFQIEPRRQTPSLLDCKEAEEEGKALSVNLRKAQKVTGQALFKKKTWCSPRYVHLCKLRQHFWPRGVAPKIRITGTSAHARPSKADQQTSNDFSGMPMIQSTETTLITNFTGGFSSSAMAGTRKKCHGLPDLGN